MTSMFLVAFNSTHHAIRFEKILKDSDMNIRTIPTPREITSSCGLSIAFESKCLDDVKAKIDEFEIDYYGVFEIRKSDSNKELIKIY